MTSRGSERIYHRKKGELVTTIQRKLELTLPDMSICRAELEAVNDHVSCLMDNPTRCQYARVSDSIASCVHPERDKIVARKEWSRRINH